MSIEINVRFEVRSLKDDRRGDRLGRGEVFVGCEFQVTTTWLGERLGASLREAVGVGCDIN